MVDILMGVPVVNNKDWTKWEHAIYKRAGFPILIKAKDNTGKRFIDFHNYMTMNHNFDWYLMGMDDYYPAKDFVKKAVEMYRKTGKRFLMLNDGKNPDEGRNASCFMIKKDYIEEIYGTGQLFWNEYKHHSCDSEITEIAKRDKEFFYVKDSIYLEVDIEKEWGNKPQTTKEDLALFYWRKNHGFPLDKKGLVI